MRDTVPAEPLTVFISGRLKEMAAERLTACAVVAAMRLRPILFEHTGPYNPERPVFLEAARTSDIFVGLYGDEYGDPVGDRLAPIEQEYLESLDFPLMPRLFLIRSSRRRQRRLRAFLQSIGPHGTAIRYEGAPDFAHVLRQGLAAIVAAAYRDSPSGDEPRGNALPAEAVPRAATIAPPAGPLRASLLVDAEGPVPATAREAIAGLGIDIAPPPAAGSPAALHPVGQIVGTDLLIAVLEQQAPRFDDALRELRDAPERPSFVFVHTALGAMPQLETVATVLDARAPVFYDGPADLHWKLAQAVAAFLSARFRLGQARQTALHGTDAASRRRAVLRLAAHRDIGQRRLGTRVALAHAIRHPQEQVVLVQQLVGRGHPDCFVVAALILQAHSRHDPEGVGQLLHELGNASPAFRAWVFARLAGNL